jgi:hypothetical protein
MGVDFHISGIEEIKLPVDDNFNFRVDYLFESLGWW